MECLIEDDEDVIDCFEKGLFRKEWQCILVSEEGEVEVELIEFVDNDMYVDKIIIIYFLKNVLFLLVDKFYNREFGVDFQNNFRDEVIVWVKFIYDYIEDCFLEKRLLFFFIFSCNLFNKVYDGG